MVTILKYLKLISRLRSQSERRQRRKRLTTTWSRMLERRTESRRSRILSSRSTPSRSDLSQSFWQPSSCEYFKNKTTKLGQRCFAPLISSSIARIYLSLLASQESPSLISLKTHHWPCFIFRKLLGIAKVYGFSIT